MMYLKAIIRRLMAISKLILIKSIHPINFKFSFPEQVVSLSTEFNINGGEIILGKRIQTRKNVEFRSTENGMIKIGENAFFNNNCTVACREKIEIGNNCSFGPNVVLYDHDHDFRVKGGKKAGKYKTGPIIIGNNVWVGANTVILRGTTIGDNCVIGAGSVIKSNIEPNTLVYKKNENINKKII